MGRVKAMKMASFLLLTVVDLGSSAGSQGGSSSPNSQLVRKIRIYLETRMQLEREMIFEVGPESLSDSVTVETFKTDPNK